MPRTRKLDREKYRKKLEALRDELMTEAQHLAERTSGRDSYSTDLPGGEAEESGGDAAQEATGRSQDAAMGESLRPMLQNVNRALEKIDEDSYGICDSCGSEIPEARLKIMPSAIECAKCREARPI